MADTAEPEPPRFDPRYRFPILSKRWKSVGRFPTEHEARTALDSFLAGRTYRSVDRWIHRLAGDPDRHAGEAEDAFAGK